MSISLDHVTVTVTDGPDTLTILDDLSLAVDAGEVLAEVADRNPLCLDEPAPVYIFKGFGESSLDMQFSVWTKRENYLALLNSIYLEIKAAFDAAGIEIPFPHRSLYTGSVTDPFPIRIVERESAD